MAHVPKKERGEATEELKSGPPSDARGAEAETDEAEGIANLRAAVLYLPPDGSQKLCGDRCNMHIESGEFKDRCTIHAPNIVIPNIASCGWYKKGPAPTGHMAMPMKPFVTPEQSGLVVGKVQCKRCVRADDDADVCIALTKVLRDVMGFKRAVFKIEPDGCCNWQRGPGQKDAEKNADGR